MAEKITTLKVDTMQGIARIEFNTSVALDPMAWEIRLHCEDFDIDADGKLVGDIRFPTRQINRAFGDVKDQKFTASAGGKSVTVTGAQLAALIKVAGYTFRTENIAVELAAEQAAAAARAAE